MAKRVAIIALVNALKGFRVGLFKNPTHIIHMVFIGSVKRMLKYPKGFKVSLVKDHKIAAIEHLIKNKNMIGVLVIISAQRAERSKMNIAAKRIAAVALAGVVEAGN